MRILFLEKLRLVRRQITRDGDVAVSDNLVVEQRLLEALRALALDDDDPLRLVRLAFGDRIAGIATRLTGSVLEGASRG